MGAIMEFVEVIKMFCLNSDGAYVTILSKRIELCTTEVYSLSHLWLFVFERKLSDTVTCF